MGNFGFIRAENDDFRVQKGQNGESGPPARLYGSSHPPRAALPEESGSNSGAAKGKEVTSTRGCGGRK